MLVATRVGMIGAAHCFYRREMLPVTFAVAPKNDHAFAGVIARSPEPVALVIADRFRQPVLLPEEIDRPSLAVAVREDCRLRALLGRKRVVNLADFAGHLFPAEFVGEMLRQRARRLVFRLWRLDPERLLITEVALGGQDRHRQWRENAANEDDRY